MMTGGSPIQKHPTQRAQRRISCRRCPSDTKRRHRSAKQWMPLWKAPGGPNGSSLYYLHNTNQTSYEIMDAIIKQL